MNRYDYVIKKANDDIKNKNIPPLPFRMCISGAMGSGKSHLIKELLTSAKYYKGVFDHIIIVSETLFLDTLYEDLIKLLPEDDLYDSYKEIIDGTIFKKIKHNATKEEQTLLILDDVANSGIFKKGSIISKFLLRSRHYYTSVIFAIQGINLLERYLRLNISHYIIFKSNNPSERKVMREQMSELVDIFNQSLKKYQFLYVNMLAHDEKDMYFLNFDHRLIE